MFSVALLTPLLSVVPIDGVPGTCFRRAMATFRYNEEIADELCNRVSEGETLLYVCNFDEWGDRREKGTFPRPYTVYAWCSVSAPNYNASFCARFAAARLAQQHFWLEETVDIANTPEYGEEVVEEEVDQDGEKPYTKTIKRVVKKEMLGHRTLKINARYRAMAMFNPKLWSDKLRAAGEDDDNDIVITGGLD